MRQWQDVMTTVHISFSHVAQRLPIAPRTAGLNKKLHSKACSCECCCSSTGERGGRRRHRSLCGRTPAPAGSALSWTPRVSRARITKYGRAGANRFWWHISSHCQCHCPAHYTSHHSYQRCGESCCPQCMGQRSRAVLSEILYSAYCRHNNSCDLKLRN